MNIKKQLYIVIDLEIAVLGGWIAIPMRSESNTIYGSAISWLQIGKLRDEAKSRKATAWLMWQPNVNQYAITSIK